MRKLESSKQKIGNKEFSNLLKKLKIAWNIDEIAKRGAYFINSPDSLLDAKLVKLSTNKK